MKYHRLIKWAYALRDEMTDGEIAAGLTNGDIEKPRWLCTSSIDCNTVRAWDDKTGSHEMGFIDFTDDEESES